MPSDVVCLDSLDQPCSHGRDVLVGTADCGSLDALMLPRWCNAVMHLNPYGEYAVLLAASLADDWPESRAGIVSRTREFGMTMEFPERPTDHRQTNVVIERWLEVVDAETPDARAAKLNDLMKQATAYPRLTDHDDEGLASALPRRRASATRGATGRDQRRHRAPPHHARHESTLTMRCGNDPRRPVQSRSRGRDQKRTAAILLGSVRKPRRRAPPPSHQKDMTVSFAPSPL